MTQQTGAVVRRLALCAVLVGAATTALMGVAARDYGLTTDEPQYIKNNLLLRAWFAGFDDVGLAESFSRERLRQGWNFGNTSTRSLPMASLVSLAGYWTVGRWDSPLMEYRWGNILALAATSGLVFYWAES